MIKAGILTISAGVSSLDGTRLVKAPFSEDPFGQATSFLRQDRLLKNHELIWIDGVDSTIGNLSVIVFTDAGRQPASAHVAAAMTVTPTTKSASKTTRQARGAADAKETNKASGQKGRAKELVTSEEGAARTGAAKKASGSKTSRKHSTKRSTNRQSEKGSKKG